MAKSLDMSPHDIMPGYVIGMICYRFSVVDDCNRILSFLIDIDKYGDCAKYVNNDMEIFRSIFEQARSLPLDPVNPNVKRSLPTSPLK